MNLKFERFNNSFINFSSIIFQNTSNVSFYSAVVQVCHTANHKLQYPVILKAHWTVVDRLFILKNEYD
jgi:hypothetical protein